MRVRRRGILWSLGWAGLSTLVHYPKGGMAAQVKKPVASGVARPHVVYVANEGDRSLSVLDGEILQVSATVALPHPPHNLVVGPTGSIVYLTAPSAHRVLRWGAQTKKVLEPLAVGDQPHGIATVPGSPYVLVATLPVGRSPHHVAISPDGQRAYIANLADGDVSVIAVATLQEVARVKVGREPHGVGVWGS